MKYLIIVVLTICLTACGKRDDKAVVAVDSPVSEVTGANELPLPHVPDSLRTVEERAAYVAEHYWDAMDFRNRAAMDTAFIEQNISNYIAIIELAPQESAAAGVRNLLRRAHSIRPAFDLITYTAERYLNNPNSPMRNEELYIVFLEALTEADYLTDDEKLRSQYQLKNALRNRPGSIAADFKVKTRSGKATTLHSLVQQADTTLLVFYDPDCEQCEQIIAQMSAQPLRRGWQVLAVDITGDSDRWSQSVGKIPSKWTDLICTTANIDDELYSIPATPVLYLLDRDSRVLLKDMALQGVDNAN